MRMLAHGQRQRRAEANGQVFSKHDYFFSAARQSHDPTSIAVVEQIKHVVPQCVAYKMLRSDLVELRKALP